MIRAMSTARVEPAAPPTAAEFDVFLAGPVFMDIVFSGMDYAPVLGAETWAKSMGSCPGGIANMAVALQRLGLSATLATAFGDDSYGDLCRECLELVEGVDISRSVRMIGKHTPLTVSLAYDGDRTMVSHGHIDEHPSVDDADIPTTRFVIAPVDPEGPVPWLATAHERGATVVLNSGWDATGAWDLHALSDLALADVFVANEVEALSWTRAENAAAAARVLAEQVGLAVVTRGRHGAVAVDRKTGELVEVAGMGTKAVDPTGAGDIFVAGLVAALAKGRTSREALTVGCVAAGLSVQELGGSLSAPTSDEIALWHAHNPARHEPGFEAEYGFLPELFPPSDHSRRRRRAFPTVGFRP